MIQIKKISHNIAEDLCRKITTNLPDYFWIPAGNEEYAIGVRTRTNFAAKIEGYYLGLISIDFPYPTNANIYWMAILQDFHRKGIGRQLIEVACKFAKDNGATTITVETLAPIESDKNYIKTYNFYQSVGFVPLFNLKPQDYE